MTPSSVPADDRWSRPQHMPASDTGGLGAPCAPMRRNAEVIRRGFEEYWAAFMAITRHAKTNFERRDWANALSCARERLDVYNRIVGDVVSRVCINLGAHDHDASIWADVKAAYAVEIAGSPASEVAESFFNSVTRRIFATVGVNPDIEFVDFAFERLPSGLSDTPFRSYECVDTTRDLVREIFADCAFSVPYLDSEYDIPQVAAGIEEAWEAGAPPMPFEAIEMLKPVFYRRKGAYLVGRVRGGNRVMPLVLCLLNTGAGVTVDAILVTEEDISVAFSFTRSYFQVEVEQPAQVIGFLRTLMPRKPTAELYSSLGFNKHAKTELYRDLRRHLAHSNERFQFAPGVPGMVMVVFTMPGFDVVFKVIRDTFAPPKRTTRDQVRRRYRLVFEHDRAGRLVDAQEFEHLAFSRHHFATDLLDELLESASHSVTVQGDSVSFKHLYSERRVKPLDVYLREADELSRWRVLMDYGQAIEDLAATGVFPGDLLFKNFGVTRHGRVIFYDYDELCLLEECTFREIPEAIHPEDELAAEPWFHVDAHDVFPEEFIHFLALPDEQRRRFRASHGALFEAAYWRELQARNGAGDVVDIFPYGPEFRIQHPPRPTAGPLPNRLRRPT